MKGKKERKVSFCPFCGALHGEHIPAGTIFFCPYCGAPHKEPVPVGVVQVKCHYCGSMVLVPPLLGGAFQRCLKHPESLSVGMCNVCNKSYCDQCLQVIELTDTSDAALAMVGVEIGLGLLSIALGRLYAPMLYQYSTEQNIAKCVYVCPTCLGTLPEAYRKKSWVFPTAHEVIEKLAEMKETYEKDKSIVKLKEEKIAEYLYRRFWNIYSNIYGGDKLLLDQLIDGYVKSGYSRIEAVKRATSEVYPESAKDETIWQIQELFLLQPTVHDAITELVKEKKRAREERARKERLAKLRLFKEAKKKLR